MDVLPVDTALLVVDLQRGIDYPTWGQRNNPAAEHAVQALLAAWRKRRMPIYHIRHDSSEPNSTYCPGQPGHDFKPETAPQAGERVIAKVTPSAFVATPLEPMLRAAGITHLVVTGVITNNSVEATVRHGANLGFEMLLVEDGCFTFGKRDWNGQWRTADDVHAMSLANLNGEYCAVVVASDVLKALPEL